MRSEMEQQDLTFQPKVNKKSSKITEIKRDNQDGNVVERLYKDAAERIEKNMNSYNESVHG